MKTSIKAGEIYDSNSFGSVEVLEFINSNNIRIRFLDTGSETTTTRSQLIYGGMKDKNKSLVYGVGYIGYGNYGSIKDGVPSKAYYCWSAMIERCYCKKFLKKSCAYIGCSVCDEWHNFQNFAEWYYKNYPTDGLKYELDKDIKIKGNKLYSPEICMFVTRKENSTQAQAKRYKLLSPSGDVVEAYNLKKFCDENGLSNRNLCSSREKSKGWILLERL